MRILYINHSTYIAGGEISLSQLINYCQTMGIEMYILLPQQGKFSEMLNKYNIKTFYLKLEYKRNRYLRIFFYLIYSFKLCKFLLKKNIDLVHANSLRSSIDNALGAKLARVKIIGHIRDIRLLGGKSIFLLNLLTIIIANSAATKKHLLKEGVKGKKIKIIYNGVDLNNYDYLKSPDVFRKKYHIKSCVPLIGIIGQLCERKGIIFFIEAAKKLSERMPKTTYIVVGDDLLNKGKYRQKMEAMVKRFGLEQKFIFTGFVKEIPEVMAAIDILILASLQEPFGRVVIEAMAMKKPVIATKVGGVSEIVLNGESGFLIPPSDSDAIANKAFVLLKDKKLAKIMGERGRCRVEKYFTIQQNIENITALYKDILESRL
jgi:glycosyltransferase involved in cell wall biosynthesis